MKGFRFRGERILEWRRVQADAARVAFVRASESAREADAQARHAQADASRTADEYVTAMKSGTSVDTIERYRNWIARQRVHVASCQKTSRERREVADAASQALQTANRHVKVMERLRERAVGRFIEAERQREMKALDQLATLQYVRRRREGSTHSGS
jgi:flagellar FliJ protein